MERRIGWDEWALGIARAVAARGDCSRSRVGAVLLDVDKRVIAVGYNGTIPGRAGCLDGVCPRASSDVAPGSSYDTGAGACIAVHAELNAVLYADPVRRKGSTLYITRAPCEACRRLIVASGVERVVWEVEDGVNCYVSKR